jgi:hypothetical protein
MTRIHKIFQNVYFSWLIFANGIGSLEGNQNFAIVLKICSVNVTYFEFANHQMLPGLLMVRACESANYRATLLRSVLVGLENNRNTVVAGSKLDRILT